MIQLVIENCCQATTAAQRAVTPIRTPPHPGTAVKDDARSIASRIKRRLSIARACNAGGSSGSCELIGRREAILESYFKILICQVLYSAKRRTWPLLIIKEINCQARQERPENNNELLMLRRNQQQAPQERQMVASGKPK